MSFGTKGLGHLPIAAQLDPYQKACPMNNVSTLSLKLTGPEFVAQGEIGLFLPTPGQVLFCVAHDSVVRRPYTDPTHFELARLPLLDFTTGEAGLPAVSLGTFSGASISNLGRVQVVARLPRTSQFWVRLVLDSVSDFTEAARIARQCL